MKYLPLLFLVVLVACVKEPFGWYPDVGVVEVSSDTTLSLFHVPDEDSPGWHPGDDGSTTKDFTITLKEKAKKDVSINSIILVFYNVDGSFIATKGTDYIPPIEIEAGKEYTFTYTVTVDEGIADDLDDADEGTDDFYGNGTIKFYVEGYDMERGEGINCIPSYTPIQVQL